MRDGEWRIVYPGTDFTFGTVATPVFNLTTPDIGDVDLDVADDRRPRADGRAFGVDFRGARTITFDLGIRGASEIDTRWEAARLSLAWRADAVRTVPGAVAELRSQYAGRERLVYGRPRRFAVNLSDVTTNHLALVTSDFACVDDLFYSPDEEVQAIQLVPPSGGGLVAPLASPLSTTPSSDRSVGIVVESEMPAWPVIEIDGPITNPVIEVLGAFRIELRTTLAYDDTVVIDTRPWVRTALRNGAGNLSGSLRGTRLAKAALPPGSYEVALRGVDATGTSSARLRWRPTYSTL